jgi:hypothetical protein
MYEILLKFPNKIKRKKVKNPTHACWAEIFPGLVLFLHFFPTPVGFNGLACFFPSAAQWSSLAACSAGENIQKETHGVVGIKPKQKPKSIT